MSGWTKLFSSLPTSSVWSEEYATRIVWTTMLAVADVEGVVEGSVPGFARLANVSVDEMKVAVERLTSPDPYTRTPDHGGRRIETIEGGWRILNYRLYRERGQAKEGSKAPAMRAWRARKRAEETNNTAQSVDGADNALPQVATSDPEERGEKKEDRKEKRVKPAPSAPPVSAEALRDLWNELTSPPIPRCREMDSTRRKAAEARLRERGIDVMRQVFARINDTPFCRGENTRGWLANFDWALKPGSIVKVMEGSYGGATTASPAAGRRDDAAQTMADLDRQLGEAAYE